MNQTAFQIEELKAELDFMRNRNSALSATLLELQQQVKTLTDENLRLKSQLEKPKNTAGRKPQNAKWQERYRKISEMMEEGIAPADIIKRLGIGRATFYRYFKLIQNQKST